MSNAKRPNLNKAASKSEKQRKAAHDAAMTIRVGDEKYTLIPADITGLMELRIRQETGYSIAQILTKAMSIEMGIDIVGCFMFAVEVSRGLDPDLTEILGSLSWATDVDIEDADGNPLKADEGELDPQP